MTYNRQNLRPQNQNNNQNVSFGRFADNRAREMAYEYLEVADDDIGYKEAAFEYLDETPFVTIKSAVNNGKTFIYAVAEKSAINKHESKDMFNEMLACHYYDIDPAKLRTNKDAKETGIIKEPGFLAELEDFTDTHNLYENFCDCETGYYEKRGSSSSSGSEPEDPFEWQKDQNMRMNL